SRSGGDGKQIDVAQARVVAFQQPDQVARKPFAVREPVVTHFTAEQDRVARKRHTALTSCRVESQHQHVKFHSTCRRPPDRPLLPARRPRCGNISTPNSSTATRLCFFAWAISTRCSTRTLWSPRARSS